jgi:hypothetical protein
MKKNNVDPDSKDADDQALLSFAAEEGTR